MEHINYNFQNVPIKGGGYVTGILFHPCDEKLLYIRTDIGGLYRFNFDGQSWIALNDNADIEHLEQTYPLSFAIDAKNPSTLISVCGARENDGFLCVSHDRGQSFDEKPLPSGCKCHGNEVGRSTGERLLIIGGRIYFASTSVGLIYSDDEGESWEYADVCGEKNCSLIAEYGGIIVVGTSGEASMQGNVRGETLFFSSGNEFKPLETPEPEPNEKCSFSGFVPQRSCFDGKYIYISFAQSGIVRFGGARAYSCDTGTLGGGRVVRYLFSKGELVECKDVTPPLCRQSGGYGGIACSNGRLYVCTLCCESGDEILVSESCGESWKCCFGERKNGRLVTDSVNHMNPNYGGGWCIHWLSDFKISPFDADFAVFNTGCGVFATHNLTSASPTFSALCDGLEETVHLLLLSPPSGENHLLDFLGDLGGFIFEDVTKQSEKMLCDSKFNRWITCPSADFAEQNPFYIVASPSGNWAGTTHGGLILSTDGGKSWRQLNDCVQHSLGANMDSGQCAVTCDGSRIFRGMRSRYSDEIYFTDNEGESWQRCLIPARVHICTDRADKNLVFAVSEDYDIFLSTDMGESFRILVSTSIANGGRRRHEEIRAWRGELYIANGIDGLYKITADGEVTNLLCGGEYAQCVGFGKNEIYICGRVGGEIGLFRSDNGGASWARINDDAHQYGEIRSICGDPRICGRIYIGSGSRGLIFGDEI
ncbi:MAG: hypothetical protein LUE12_00490 [Ruminococcus sp.]|nr:hypothetical protein [Ruminococcus sp.]